MSLAQLTWQLLDRTFSDCQLCISCQTSGDSLGRCQANPKSFLHFRFQPMSIGLRRRGGLPLMNDGGAIVLNASIAGNQGISSHERLSFLASDEASYISGIELFVDGGVDKFKTCINILSESK